MSTLRSSAIPVSDPSAGLRITEIFDSLQGEANTSGPPTVFIPFNRLSTTLYTTAIRPILLKVASANL